jgi:general nucleoside transport system permease protein
MPFTDIAVALQISFTYFTVIYLTGTGGLFSERSGIVNIGLEGLMIIGTVTGAFGVRFFTDTLAEDFSLFGMSPPDLGLVWGPLLGLLFGALCGAIFASLHAVATITFRVDHIVSGVVINLVAVGLARFLSSAFFSGQSTQSDPGGPHLARWDLPGLSSLPAGISRAFEGLSPVVILAALMVFPVWFSLNRLRWGLRLRSCGENPEATRSLGVSVPQYRYQGVILSGAFAGASGAFLAAEVIGNWREGQTLGLGFISLAALILSNWNPIRLLFFAWLFGFAVAIPLRLDDAPVISILPEQFIRMIPYIVTIVAIAGFVGRVRPPAAAGKAYEGAGGA